jgi:subtilisin-like proprotein convertase family protein
MNLLRPLFCEEQVQYATEDFQSGLLLVTSLIPGGLREAYSQLRPSVEPVVWPWRWLNNQDGRIRLAAPESVEPVLMVPVRGNADVDYENRLVAAGALPPLDIIRIRALDWKRPVFSGFRCELWKSALARFETEPPKLDPASRNADRMLELLPEIMQLDGVPLAAGKEGDVIALDLAGDDAVDALRDALEKGTLDQASCSAGAGFCAVDVTELGGMLDLYVSGFEARDAVSVRRELTEVRDERLCHVARVFPNAPALPEVDCRAVEPGPPMQPTTFRGENADSAAIPDNDPAGLASPISALAAQGLTVQTVQVFVDIDHSWRGDLKITLTPPGGDPVDVVAFDPDDSADDVVGRFDVAGLVIGARADGAWTLKVVDRAEADRGKLRKWSIGINEPAP